MYSEIKNLIENSHIIIIHRHSRPDGDAIGSQLGLKYALQLNYPEKEIYAVGDENEKFTFLGKMDVISDEKYHDALVFVLDTPEEVMISDERYKLGKFLIKIDHHLQRSTFGNINLVDSTYESCASLVADLLFKLNLKLNDYAAKCFFTGIVTDSGRFRYDQVNARTFQITSKLLETNFKMSEVYSNLYEEDLKIVRLKSYFTLNFQVTKNNVAYMMTSKEKLKEWDVDFFTVSRGMVNTMSGIKGIDIWVNFTEDEKNNCVVAEIRSSKYDINKIATKYGGGGHMLASGASLKDFDEAYKMLEDLDKLIVEAKNG